MTETSSFKILIVDDEPDARNLLKAMVQQIRYTEVVGEAANVEEALYSVLEYYPDLILMDISMPGRCGLDLIHLIKRRNIDIPVILTSAHKEYALQALQNQVYDFLVKPVIFENLKEKIEKYRRMNERSLPHRLMEVLESIQEDSKIRINSRYSYVLIDPSEIVFCQSEDGYTVIYLSNGKEEVASASLSQIEDMVGKWNFFRLSRSVLINQEYIRSVNKTDDVCIMKCCQKKWEIRASHRSIMDLLETSFNYA